MVVKELDKNPNADIKSLQAQAKEIDPSVGDLSPRQFHARYPLQAKRRKAAGAPRKGAARKGAKRGGRGASKRGKKQESASAAQTPRAGRSRGASSGGEQPGAREKLRSLFLEFATEFAEAESRSEIVRVLSSVDSYVGRAEKLTAR